jgi:hypothetical protein
MKIVQQVLSSPLLLALKFLKCALNSQLLIGNDNFWCSFHNLEEIFEKINKTLSSLTIYYRGPEGNRIISIIFTKK